MKASRTKSAMLNVFFNLLYQILNTVVNLLIPPMIMTKFGSVINGLVSTIKQILGYVQLFGAGISESTVVSLYKPLSDKNYKKINSIFNACATTFFRMGMLFNIVALLIAFIYPLFMEEGIDYFFCVILILVLSVAGASEFFIIGKCRTLLIADQKIYIVNIAQITGAIANLIITIILIYMDASILIVQAGASIVYVMRIIIVYGYVKKYYSFLDNKVEPDYSAISKRRAATIHQLSIMICYSSQTVIVSLFSGFVEASIYSVYNTVFIGINTILSTVSSALLSVFGDIIANDTREKLNRLYRYYETIYNMLVFILYSITYTMFVSFVELYTAGANDADYVKKEYAILFCAMGIINCIRTPGATIINAIGHYKETQNRAIIEMSICFVLELVLINYMGAIGVVIATIVAYAYGTADVIRYSNNVILKQSVRKTGIKILINVILFLVVMLGVTIIELPVISSYLSWLIVALIVGVIVTVLYLGVNGVVYLNDFKGILSYITRGKR